MSNWLDFPIKTSRWRIAVLRVIFRRREWVQLRRGGNIYWLRFFDTHDTDG